MIMGMAKKRTRSIRRKQRKVPPQFDRWLDGLAAMGNEAWKEAITYFEAFTAREQDPENITNVTANLIVCYLELGQYNEALLLVDKLNKLSPDYPDVWYTKAVIYAHTDELDKAIEALEMYRRLLPLENSQIDRWLKTVRQEKEGIIPANTFLADWLETTVTHSLELGDLEVLERRAHRIIEITESRPQGHFLLGLALLEQGRYAEALAAFQAAYERDADYVPTLHNIGYCLFELDRLDEAEQWLEKARQQDETFLASLHLLGGVHQKAGRLDQAIALWQEVLARKPDHEAAHLSLIEARGGQNPDKPPAKEDPQFRLYAPKVKAEMDRPQIYHSGDVTVTFDPSIGFVLEDEGNPRNRTLYAGGPFGVRKMSNHELFQFIGVLKLLTKQAHPLNCRGIAMLAYYDDQPPFNYCWEVTEDEMTEQWGNGRLLTDPLPNFFKLRIDSSMDSPYGSPFSGYFIYVRQNRQSGQVISTIGVNT